MPTHAELSAKLLRDAATFFRTLAQHNEPLRAQMTENATVFEQMADFVINDPRGTLDGTPTAHLAGRLLKDAATFFKTLAEQNEPIREQMAENANVYDQLGDLVMADPLGILV
jgi:ABC-type transporter Mla subunit MlaD